MWSFPKAAEAAKTSETVGEPVASAPEEEAGTLAVELELKTLAIEIEESVFREPPFKVTTELFKAFPEAVGIKCSSVFAEAEEPAAAKETFQ